eukprot:jgi/Mesvir1/17499/Mv08765-RA.2
MSSRTGPGKVPAAAVSGPPPPAPETSDTMQGFDISSLDDMVSFKMNMAPLHSFCSHLLDMLQKQSAKISMLEYEVKQRVTEERFQVFQKDISESRRYHSLRLDEAELRVRAHSTQLEAHGATLATLQGETDGPPDDGPMDSQGRKKGVLERVRALETSEQSAGRSVTSATERITNLERLLPLPAKMEQLEMSVSALNTSVEAAESEHKRLSLGVDVLRETLIRNQLDKVPRLMETSAKHATQLQLLEKNVMDMRTTEKEFSHDVKLLKDVADALTTKGSASYRETPPSSARRMFSMDDSEGSHHSQRGVPVDPDAKGVAAKTEADGRGDADDKKGGGDSEEKGKPRRKPVQRRASDGSVHVTPIPPEQMDADGNVIVSVELWADAMGRLQQSHDLANEAIQAVTDLMANATAGGNANAGAAAATAAAAAAADAATADEMALRMKSRIQGRMEELRKGLTALEVTVARIEEKVNHQQVATQAAAVRRLSAELLPTNPDMVVALVEEMVGLELDRSVNKLDLIRRDELKLYLDELHSAMANSSNIRNVMDQLEEQGELVRRLSRDKADKGVLDEAMHGINGTILKLANISEHMPELDLPEGLDSGETTAAILRQLVENMNGLSRRVQFTVDMSERAARKVASSVAEREVHVLQDELQKLLLQKTVELRRECSHKPSKADVHAFLIDRIREVRANGGDGSSGASGDKRPARLQKDLADLKAAVKKEFDAVNERVTGESTKSARLDEAVNRLQELVTKKANLQTIQEEVEKLLESSNRAQETINGLQRSKADQKDVQKIMKVRWWPKARSADHLGDNVMGSLED